MRLGRLQFHMLSLPPPPPPPPPSLPLPFFYFILKTMLRARL